MVPAHSFIVLAYALADYALLEVSEVDHENADLPT